MMEKQKMKAIIEAVLFAFGDGVEIKDIESALGCETRVARALIREMEEDYEAKDRGVRIVRFGDSYMMSTKKELFEYLIRIKEPSRTDILSDVLLETLAIVAYNQPVTRKQIEKIRGVNSHHAVNKLVEYGLVKEIGRMDVPGKPLLFGTTDLFYKRFGIPSKKELTSSHKKDEPSINLF